MAETVEGALVALRDELLRQFFAETSREDRDSWSRGFSHGLRVALNEVEERLGWEPDVTVRT